jgi:hypothetical protein
MCNEHRQPAIRRIARKITSAIAEDHDAQRRALELRLSPERNVFTPNAAPTTYAEFLFRTSGRLPHEPPARARTGRMSR